MENQKLNQETVEEILATMPPEFRKIALSLYQRISADPEPDSYDCPICHDTGWISYVQENGYRASRECECQKAKKARRLMELSGLKNFLDTLTFERYEAKEPWQIRAKKTAQAWVETVRKSEEKPVPWLFCGGAVGSGKTHLCTEACGELLKGGKAVKYMLWPEESLQLKACINDEEEFDRLSYPLKCQDVLYIDDLFKMPRSHGERALRPSASDVKVAFELIDARYRRDLPTIISCEWLMDELLQIDEGLFSRVYQQTKPYIVQISRKPGRNYRTADLLVTEV